MSVKAMNVTLHFSVQRCFIKSPAQSASRSTSAAAQ